MVGQKLLDGRRLEDIDTHAGNVRHCLCPARSQVGLTSVHDQPYEKAISYARPIYVLSIPNMPSQRHEKQLGFSSGLYVPSKMLLWQIRCRDLSSAIQHYLSASRPSAVVSTCIFLRASPLGFSAKSCNVVQLRIQGTLAVPSLHTVTLVSIYRSARQHTYFFHQ